MLIQPHQDVGPQLVSMLALVPGDSLAFSSLFLVMTVRRW